ncbi:MAG TPA: hypothetical protein VH327_08845 [Gammaproteobacteria bacterium]|nr:hypothetical protein [Gammaproteobacteria bacterium]
MRSRRSDGLWIVFLGLLAFTAAVSALPAPGADLGTIVANNQRVVTRGQDTSGIDTLEIALTMHDSGQDFDADYKVTRNGRMRIDILKGGKRVYTEAYDGHRGWDLGKDGSAAVVDPHGDALWHGTQFPGNIFTLKDMQANGHKLEYMGRERLEGVDYYVLKLTLSDGFVTYRYVNPKTWLIDRARDFRAFHPAVDGHQTWVETASSDYRPVEGLMYAFLSTNTDVTNGKQLAIQKATSIKINPKLDPALFQMPAGSGR